MNSEFEGNVLKYQGSRKGSGRSLRNLLIEPFKQIKFGLYMLVLCLTFIIASGALFINSFMEQYQQVIGIFNIVDPSLQWDVVLNDVFYNNVLRLGVFYLVFLMVFFYVIFKLTHRYYGPLVSIERFLGEIRNGNYSARISIRSKDELQTLVISLNEVAHILEDTHGVFTKPANRPNDHT